MPPRSLKSISTSIAFVAWILGQYPGKRILAVSYSETLAEKLAFDCMKVLDAEWYREIFPLTRIARNRSRRFDFETTRGGGRYYASVGGALTGRGGDIIIIDDPHKPDEAQSDVRRKSVLDWYASTLLSRCNDPVKTPIILIQQRIHENDLAGMLLEQGGWEHLNLQAMAEEAANFDLGRRGVFHREEGDLLHPARLPRKLLEEYQVDRVRIDLNACSADMLVDDGELERRRAALPDRPFAPESQSPWQEIFREKVRPFSEGMTLRGADDFKDIAAKYMPRDNH